MQLHKTIRLSLLLSIYLLDSSTNVVAQVSKEERLKDRVNKTKVLDENFMLLNTLENTDFTTPFIVSGKGVPEAIVEVHITPSSTGGKSTPVFISKNGSTRYARQDFTVKVDEKGNWAIPEKVIVSFKEGAKKRSVRIFAGQSKDGFKSTKPIQRDFALKEDVNLIIVKASVLPSNEKVIGSFKVFTQNGIGITAASPNETNTVAGLSNFTIGGEGEPKSKVKVEIYYSGTKEVYKKSAKAAGVKVYTEKQTSTIKNKLLQSKEVTIDNDGTWGGFNVKPLQPKSGDIGTTITMTEINISFKAINGSKEVLSKVVKLKLMPTIYTRFF